MSDEEFFYVSFDINSNLEVSYKFEEGGLCTVNSVAYLFSKEKKIKKRELRIFLNGERISVGEMANDISRHCEFDVGYSTYAWWRSIFKKSKEGFGYFR